MAGAIRSLAVRGAATAALAAFGLAAGAARGAAPSFEADCRALARFPNRLTGSESLAGAAGYVSSRLRALDPDAVVTQRFAAARLRAMECDLTLDGSGATLPLSPARANSLMAPVTPAEGLSGPIVHAGAGRPEDFQGRPVRDAIVVLDYNGGGWMRAFRLGALAVVFVRNGPAESWRALHLDANANLPRYFYAGPRDDLPEGRTARIRCSAVWERAGGCNVLALFRGTDPAFGRGPEELVVLAAALDTFGEVPDLSPGARGAANVAALLRIAEGVSRSRPRRHVLAAVFDAQAQGHLGCSHFYRALEADKAAATAERRAASVAAEQAFLDAMLKLISPDRLPAGSSPARRRLLGRLTDRAAEHAYAAGDAMRELRLRRQALLAGPATPEAAGSAGQIARELADRWQPQKDEWNALRRAIGAESDEGLAPGARLKLAQILGEAREDVRRRMDELAGEREAADSDLALKGAIGKHWIALHASLLLGDSTSRWGLAIGGHSGLHAASDNPGLYGKVQSVFLRSFREAQRRGAASLFEEASASQALPDTSVLWAGPAFVHSGEIAGLSGVYNLALVTCQEAAPREGTPDDTLDRLDMDAMQRQADDIGLLLFGAGWPAAAEGRPSRQRECVADQEGLSLRRGIVAAKDYAMSEFRGDATSGPTVMGAPPGSAIPNTPAPGAVLQVALRPAASVAFSSRKPPAFQDVRVVITGGDGGYSLGPLPGGMIWWQYRGFAAVFDARGGLRAASDYASSFDWFARINVFDARSGWLALPPVAVSGARAGLPLPQVFSARDDGELNIEKSYVELWEGVLAWYSDRREEGIKAVAPDLLMALNTGDEAFGAGRGGVTPTGRGFPMLPQWTPFPAARRAAVDLWRLNDSRLRLLQGRNIMDASLAELHGRAEDLLAEAAKGPVTPRTEALDAASYMASRPVYTQTRRLLDDLVRAVLILLGLSVPFAFAVERVAIGARTVYRQIAGFAACFAATFVILLLSHPAFAIANTPVIILLGFAVLVLAVLVIAIIMRRFESELKALQGMPATVHAADVSRAGTLLAAVHMGLSTMRRRPLRTALTAVTIVLLTFTILSFASFGTQSGVVRMYAAPLPGYAGAFLHAANWSPMPDEILDPLRGRWDGEAEIFERRWISPRLESAAGVLLSRRDGTRPVPLKGVLGLCPGEVRRRPDLAALFDAELAGRVLLTRSVAAAVGVAPGDRVLLGGVPLAVGRLFDGAAAGAAADMDCGGILPVDFVEARSSQPQAADPMAQLVAPAGWASMPADEVAVVSADTAARLGGALHAVSFYTPDTARAARLAQDLARMTPVPVAATAGHGVYRHVLGTVVAASGAGDLLFPILLGGLVIFGTMLGSVADREREIYTFSALGLAPRHVAMLFLSESAVYSLIGGMGGYLLANGTLRALTLLADRGWVTVPEMNMTSTHTIVTMLLVMATVLASAVYPAVRASRSANPGLLRAWRPPPPEGDTMDMLFPFTVSEYDLTGVASFLKEHFDSHSDTGIGRFMARDSRIAREPDGGLCLRAFVTLAPFDLGVSQDFLLRSAPSRIPGIDEVRIRLGRRSGQPKDWTRLNRVFLDDLRQQFLIWRSLRHDAMEGYRRRTVAGLGGEDA